MSAFVNFKDFNDASEWNDLSAAIDAIREECQEDENMWNDICSGIQAFGEEYQCSIDIHDYEGLRSELSEEEQERLNFREMHIYLLEMQGHTRCEAEIVVYYYDSIYEV
jgi:hypothetical protein